jgi:hypothetical protein
MYDITYIPRVTIVTIFVFQRSIWFHLHCLPPYQLTERVIEVISRGGN